MEAKIASQPEVQDVPTITPPVEESKNEPPTPSSPPSTTKQVKPLSLAGGETAPEPIVDALPQMVRRIRLVAVPSPEPKSVRIHQSGNEILWKCGLLFIVIFTLLIVIITLMNKHRRNLLRLKALAEHPEVRVVRPEVHYNIMITPELIKRLANASKADEKISPPSPQ